MWTNIGPEPSFAMSIVLGLVATILIGKYVKDPRDSDGKGKNKESMKEGSSSNDPKV